MKHFSLKNISILNYNRKIEGRWMSLLSGQCYKPMFAIADSGFNGTIVIAGGTMQMRGTLCAPASES